MLKIFENIKSLFRSKRKKLILVIKKKTGKEVDEYDINEYRKETRKYPDTHSDIKILELMLDDSSSISNITTCSHTVKTSRSISDDDYSYRSSYSSSDSYSSDSSSSSSSCD